jgi:hypothetical protein
MQIIGPVSMFTIFDHFQSCAMIFDTEGNSGEFVELVASQLNYLGPQDLTQYFIRHTSMNLTTTGYIAVEVVLGRRLLGTLLTVYIPTILLVIIAHMTNYFKPFFFEAVVSVNLTVMLVSTINVTSGLIPPLQVLATMFISVSQNLPKTSYIKMVDIWLIFNLMIPFFEVRQFVFIQFLSCSCRLSFTHILTL